MGGLHHHKLTKVYHTEPVITEDGNPGPIIKYRSLSSLFLSKQTLCILEISTTLPFELLLFSRYQDCSFTKVDLVRKVGKMMANGYTFLCLLLPTPTPRRPLC